MKQAAVRVEIIKGDEAKGLPWKRVVRVIERDRSMQVFSDEFETREELKATLAATPLITRAQNARKAG